MDTPAVSVLTFLLNILTDLDQLSGALILIGFIPYIWSIFFGNTKPIRSMWWSWVIVDGFLLASMLLRGETENIGQILGAVLGVFIVAVISLWRGQTMWSWSDYLCIAGAVVGVVLLMLLPDGVWHFIIPALCMWCAGLSAFPAIARDYRSESLFGWMFWAGSCVPALIAINGWGNWTVAGWSPENAAQKLSFAFLDIPLLCWMLYLRFAVWKGWRTLPALPGEDNPDEEPRGPDHGGARSGQRMPGRASSLSA